VPLAGGIALVLTRMNEILEVDTVNMLVRLQPGVVTADLQAEALRHGLYYPPDPASQRQSTIGGNVAMCAGGPHGLKYGVTKDYVLGLEAVTADGRVMRTGGKMIKNVTGYNLTQLLVGSEGTLAVITEIILRLVPRPRSSRTAMAVFPHIDDASRMITTILNAGIVPATIEIMDQESIRCVEEWQHAGLPVDAEAILIIELDGEPGAVAVEQDEVALLCHARGASEVRVAADAAESNRLWAARRAVSASMARIRPTKLGEDISVPRSAIPDALRAVREIAAKYRLQIPVYGHISDGNLHPNILFDRHDPEEVDRVNRAAAEIFDAAVRLGGTLTGEHGIGSLKKQFLALALDPVELEMMQRVKAAFDPRGILNPGKVFPATP
jgi:glycolate oxidase